MEAIGANVAIVSAVIAGLVRPPPYAVVGETAVEGVAAWVR